MYSLLGMILPYLAMPFFTLKVFMHEIISTSYIKHDALKKHKSLPSLVWPDPIFAQGVYCLQYKLPA